MNLLTPPPDVAALCLRAMKMVAAAGPRGLGTPARNLMMAAQRHVLQTDGDLDSLSPITPEALQAGFPPGPLRPQFVQAMVMMSIVDGEPTVPQMKLVEQFAAALDTDLPALHTIRRLADQQMLLFRLDFMRRSHVTAILQDQYKHHGGLLGVVRGLLGQRGYLEDPALAARYRALEDLPEGTLGRSLIAFYGANGYAVPGEKGGFPEGGIYHDFAHVLSGYGPTPEGETLVGCFSAGFNRRNPLFIILFVFLTFGAAVNVTPLEQARIEGILATPGLADRAFRAHARGQAMTTDIADNWYFWPLVALPLEEARARLGVPPE